MMNEKMGNVRERLNEMLLELGTMEKGLLDAGIVDVDLALALLRGGRVNLLAGIRRSRRDIGTGTGAMAIGRG